MKHKVIQDETGMFDQKCSLELWPADPLVKEEDVEKYNQCHGDNGRFCSGGGGGGGGGGSAQEFDPNDVPVPPEMMAVNIPLPDKDAQVSGEYANITRDEMKALASYVGPDYAFINAYSRNPNSGPDGEHFLQMATKIDSLIAKSPPLKGEEIVYRGMHLPPGMDKQLVKGAIIQDKGFMSTTIDRDVAKNFGTTTFNIRVPKGYHAVKVQAFITGTTAVNEKEMLLPRGTKLKITHVREERGGFLGLGAKKYTVDARVVDE